jgi:hypothetical protein
MDSDRSSDVGTPRSGGARDSSPFASPSPPKAPALHAAQWAWPVRRNQRDKVRKGWIGSRGGRAAGAERAACCERPAQRENAAPAHTTHALLQHTHPDTPNPHHAPQAASTVDVDPASAWYSA